MNRRWFLRGLTGAIAGVAISEELIEALKPKSTISLPAREIRFVPHDYMMGIEKFEARIMRPRVLAFANNVDHEMMKFYFAKSVGIERITLTYGIESP
jgi:hypothetical protein